jgi:hypothetical protein
LNNGNWNGNQILDSAWVKNINNQDTMFRYDGYKNQWWGTYKFQRFDDSLSAAKHIISMGKKTGMMPLISNASKDGYYIHYPGTDFMAEGILGQYIYVCTNTKVIVVRTGHDWTGNNMKEDDLFNLVANNLALGKPEPE